MPGLATACPVVSPAHMSCSCEPVSRRARRIERCAQMGHGRGVVDGKRGSSCCLGLTPDWRSFGAAGPCDFCVLSCAVSCRAVRRACRCVTVGGRRRRSLRRVRGAGRCRVRCARGACAHSHRLTSCSTTRSSPIKSYSKARLRDRAIEIERPSRSVSISKATYGKFRRNGRFS